MQATSSRRDGNVSNPETPKENHHVLPSCADFHPHNSSVNNEDTAGHTELIVKSFPEPDMVAHTFSPSTQEAEAGLCRVRVENCPKSVPSLGRERNVQQRNATELGTIRWPSGRICTFEGSSVTTYGS
ncbi:hypothetical protein U0070_008676 [Myodes glareolus]|uniref:Uncharacterized protein n=1 Tax=Myodes glareolus TaxID=447135 RepID=A0AAW0IA24_MYOGA